MLEKRYPSHWSQKFMMVDPMKIRVPDDLNQLIAPKEKALIVIDSLHRLPKRRSSAMESIDEWLTKLNAICRDNEEITILSIAELNRASYGKNGGIGGAKHTGSVEYLCHDIIRLDDTKEPGIKKLLALACRLSGTGLICELGLTKYQSFVEGLDLDEFRKIRHDYAGSKNQEIINEIELFLSPKESGEKLYLQDVKEELNLDIDTRLLGNIFKEMGYQTSKEDKTIDGRRDRRTHIVMP